MYITGFFYFYQMNGKLTLTLIIFLCYLAAFGQEVDYRVREHYNSFLERSISIGVDPMEFKLKLVGIYINMEPEPNDWARTHQNKSGVAIINISEIAEKQQLEVLVYHELTHFLLGNTQHYIEGPLLIQPGQEQIFNIYNSSPEYYRRELFNWLKYNL